MTNVTEGNKEMEPESSFPKSLEVEDAAGDDWDVLESFIDSEIELAVTGS